MAFSFEHLNNSTIDAFGETIVLDPTGTNQSLQATVEHRREQDYDSNILVDIVEIGYIHSAANIPVRQGTRFAIGAAHYTAMLPPLVEAGWATCLLKKVSS